MKKCILLLLSAAIPFLLSAQAVIFVSPGTNLYIKSSTIFHAAGLTLVPSSSFTLNDVTLQRNATLVHMSANPSINRAYYFNNTTAPFNGAIQVDYNTSELNGLSELLLRPNIHNGISWRDYASTLNDFINHDVVSAVFSSSALSEITLANVFSPLSINWGNVSAARKGRASEITWTTFQEQGISHFDIEYSVDAKSWTVAVAGISASNQANGHQYLQTDWVYKPQALFYRVAEKDMNGRAAYSAAVPLAAAAQNEITGIYPNPASDRFYISFPAAEAIASVDLYSSSGVLMKSWTGGQAVYPVTGLARGVYIVSIKTNAGLSQSSRLVVR